MVTLTAPLPGPVTLARLPMLTGEANEPLASDSWAVTVLPALKALPVAENGMLRLCAPHRLPLNVAMVRPGALLTVTFTVRVTWQPFLLPSPQSVLESAVLALLMAGFWAAALEKVRGPVQQKVAPAGAP